ncbi:MAG: hypothetical protein ACFFFC_08345 [Candidatus Thorarchaeota archaeon]
MQNRNYRKAFAAGLIAIILVASWLAMTSYPPTPSFEWNVQTGNTFTFLVTVLRTSSPYIELNNTLVTVEITELPDLSNDWNETEFIDEVLDSSKSTIVLPIVHQNGTTIGSNATDFINEAISRCFLPIGGWFTLDRFYPDQSDPGDYGYSCDTHFSYFQNDLFVIGFLSFYYDGGYGWEGEVELDTGIPQEIRIWQTGLMPEFYEITLSLQST